MKINPHRGLVAPTVSCQKLLERIPDIAWLMTDRREVVMANQRWYERVGQGTNPNRPRLFDEMLIEADRGRFLLAWATASQAVAPLSMELRLSSASGDEPWFVIELEPDRNELGHLTWIGTAVPLVRAVAIAGQPQSAQFLEALLAHVSDGIVACDAEGRLVLFNHVAQITHELTAAPIEPEGWSEHYNLYDAEGLRLLTASELPLCRALQGEVVINQEMMIKPPHSTPRSVLANSTPIYSSTGEKLGAVVLARDITAYKQAMAALQQSEQKFRAIFDGTFGFIGLLNADGTIVNMNRTALEFAQVTAEAVSGQPFGEVSCWQFSPALHQQLQDWLQRAAQGEFIRQEIELQGAGQQLVPIDFTLTPINNAQGETTLIIVEGRDLSQIKQAETARIRAQIHSERLSIAMRTAKAAAWTLDVNQQKVAWTPEFEILFDYEPGSTQQIYSEWRDRLHPADREQAERKWQEALERQSSEFRNEYRIIRRDGQIRWMDVIGESHQDAQGNIEYLSGLIYDITERKQNEEALHRSEEFTRRILESNQDCIKVLDLSGRLLYMNDNGQTLMEIDDFTTVLNSQWLNFWQGSAAEMAQVAFDTAKAGGVGKFEAACWTTKGTPKWWEVMVTAILDTEGKVGQILSVSRDITDRRAATIALQASEAQFRQTFEQTSIGIAHVGLDGSWLRVNRKLCDIVGYSPVELLPTTFQSISEPDDLAEDLSLVQQLIQGEISEYSLEKRYIHKQGHRVWACLTVSLVRAIPDDSDQLGAPQYFISVVQDITARKQYEQISQAQAAELQRLNDSLISTQQSLNERNEELDRFGHMVSHDLKAPLRAIANLSSWIEEDLIDQIPLENRQQLQLLRQRVSRMDALIDGLLRYSQTGRKAIATETVDVTQLLSETIDSLMLPTSFTIDILSPLPTLQTKRILLSQVFANLLSNAIKHHNRHDGRVEISVTELGDRYQFTIADDGPGIPAGTARDRIFEIFQTLKSVSSTQNTGIGLALIKKIVEDEGGQIWLEDAYVNGACFCFTWLKQALTVES